MNLEFTERSAFELNAILDRLPPASATKFLSLLQKSVRRILSFPDSGTLVPEPDYDLVRQFTVKAYRFFYYYDPRADLITILEVWHTAQEVKRAAQPDASHPQP